MNNRFVYVLGFILAVTACKKNDTPKINSSPTVYVAGIGDDSALYWKNGISSNLYGSAGNVYANSIFVAGTDIYVAGKQALNGGFVATLWKNKIPIPLPDQGTSLLTSANSVVVSGGDVYVAGSTDNQGSEATYWKNGVAVYLPSPTSTISPSVPNSTANAIWVSGSDVYVAGASVLTGSTLYAPTLWKNGIPVVLTKPGEAGTASSVYVYNGDVYVAGEQFPSDGSGDYTAVYWKNGVLTELSANKALANAIAVSDGSVFVAGVESINSVVLGTVWKNGIATHLTDPTVFSYASSIAVSGGDVYVAGDVLNSAKSPTAAFWKNGAINIFQTTNSIAYGLYLK